MLDRPSPTPGLIAAEILRDMSRVERFRNEKRSAQITLPGWSQITLPASEYVEVRQ